MDKRFKKTPEKWRTTGWKESNCSKTRRKRRREREGEGEEEAACPISPGWQLLCGPRKT